MRNLFSEVGNQNVTNNEKWVKGNGSWVKDEFRIFEMRSQKSEERDSSLVPLATAQNDNYNVAGKANCHF